MPGNHKNRTGLDRRKCDIGPPAGWKERRRNPERRLPEVAEISIEEFNRIMQESNYSTPDQPGGEKEKTFNWEEVRKL